MFLPGWSRLVQAGYRRAPPGTLTKLPATELAPLRIHLIDYNAVEITIYDDVETSECRPFLQRDSVIWVHVQSQPSEAVLREPGDIFQLHSLARMFHRNAEFWGVISESVCTIRRKA